MTPAGKTRDAEATRAAILDAAEGLFAKHGFAGTSLAAIADICGASAPLILHHFKDKRGLYRAVKEAIVKRYAACWPAPSETVSGLPDILSTLMSTMFAYYKQNPTMVRIANWSLLEGDDEPWGGESEWLQRYIGQIQEAQRRGEIRSDIPPYRVLIIINGAIHTWWEYHEHMLRDLEQADDPDAADAGYFHDLRAVLLQGLAPKPDGGS